MFKVLLLVFVPLLLLANVSYALCVNADEANLRSAPSSNSEILWTVGKYMPLIGVSQKGVWIQVKDLEGKKMWIHGALVSEDIDCAVIKVSKSTLRRAPSSKASKTALSYAYKYTAFKKINRDGAWLELQDDYGFKHWVNEKSLWEPLAYTQLNY